MNKKPAIHMKPLVDSKSTLDKDIANKLSEISEMITGVFANAGTTVILDPEIKIIVWVKVPHKLGVSEVFDNKEFETKTAKTISHMLLSRLCDSMSYYYSNWWHYGNKQTN